MSKKSFCHNMFTDIDECKNLTAPCGKYNFIRCENTVGDYLCRCYHGFEFSKESKECKGNLMSSSKTLEKKQLNV